MNESVNRDLTIASFGIRALRWLGEEEEEEEEALRRCKD